MMSLLIVTLLAIGAWNYTSAEKFDTEACVIFYPNKNWGGNNYSICASDDKCHDVYHTWGDAISSFKLYAAADGITLYSNTNCKGDSQHYNPTDTICPHNFKIL